MSEGEPKIDNGADYYEILGVSKDASHDDLKKAYDNHSDEGGDPEKLKELDLAYEVLSDPVRREIYHKYRRDIVRSLEVSLEDLYNATSKKKQYSTLAICSTCNGKGSKSAASIMTCSACLGSGMKAHTRHFIPGTLHPCYQCKGTGETLSDTISEEDRCEQCKGEKVVKEKTVLEVPVEKGMQNGQKITLPRDVHPTTTGGHLVYILQQNEHSKFKRKGDDLFVEHTISAVEALYGFQFELTHLDKRQLIIKSKPKDIVKPGQFKAISDEGMPMYQEPSKRGKLYIRFTVEFPDEIAPPSPQLTVGEGGKEITLDHVDQQQAQEAYDDMLREMKKKTTLHDENHLKGMREKNLQARDEIMRKVMELDAREEAVMIKVKVKQGGMIKSKMMKGDDDVIKQGGTKRKKSG